MNAHEHYWILEPERDERGRMIVPAPSPPLWTCGGCEQTYRGENAPDGKTFDQGSDAYHDALDRAGRP